MSDMRPAPSTTATAVPAVPLSEVGAAGGVAQLDSSARLPLAQAPSSMAQVVVHGATAGTARPSTATQVHWIGSVQPNNAATNDEWTDTVNKLIKRWTGAAWDAFGSASYVMHAGPSNGTDDTATIQALLTAARVAGGGVVRGMPGAAYKTTAALVIGSGTALDLTGCSLTLTGNASILTNYAFSNPVRTVTDGAITATSTTLTSATAAFTSADVGRSVTVAGAGPSASFPLCARIASVTNGTTVVLDTAAITTASGASTKLYDRDTRIKIIGGRWVTANNGTGGGTTVHHMILCRVDDLVIDLEGFTAGTSGSKYAVYPADVTNFDISVRGLNAASDGVHIQGPAWDGVIRHVEGTTHDDFVVLGTADTGGAAYNFTAGDITDVEITDVRPHGLTTFSSVKLYGVSNTNIKRVHIESVRGQSGVNGIAVGANDVTGVNCDDISIGNVDIDGLNCLIVNATGGTLRARALSTRAATGIAQVVVVNAIASWGTLDLGSIDVPNGSALTAGADMVAIYGTVTDLYLREAKWTSPGSGKVLSLPVAGSSVTRAYLSKITNANGSGFIKAAVSGSTLGTVWLTDCYQTGSAFLADLNTTTTLNLSNVVHANFANGSLNLGSVAVVTVFGTGARGIAGNLSTTAGYSLRVNCPDFACDVSKVTSYIIGDKLQNTSTSANPFVAGLLVNDGSVWRPTTGYMTKGTVALVGGTATVSNTHITGTTEIRLTTLSPGGTVGHVYVSARTPATSFAITSTSGTDTSTILWEIVSWS